MFERDDLMSCKVIDETCPCDVSNALNFLVDAELKHPHDDEDEWWSQLYEHKDFLDDMHNFRRLDWRGVVNARRLEIEFFKKVAVCEKYRGPRPHAARK